MSKTLAAGQAVVVTAAAAFASGVAVQEAWTGRRGFAHKTPHQKLDTVAIYAAVFVVSAIIVAIVWRNAKAKRAAKAEQASGSRYPYSWPRQPTGKR